MSASIEVLKVLRRGELAQLVAMGVCAGSPDDLRDGFVHLSTPEQLDRTLAKHFANEDDLFVVRCRLNSDDTDLKWERTTSGALYPHLYRPLALADVANIEPVLPARSRRPPRSE